MPDLRVIEAAARGFAQGLVGGIEHPLPPAKAPARRSTPRRAVSDRQIPLDLPAMPDIGAAPVPEFTNGEPPGPVVTQAEMERMERTLRGEVQLDAYVPEDAEVKPWIGG